MIEATEIGMLSPAAVHAHKLEREVAVATKMPVSIRGRQTVLVVDDMPILREAMAEALRQLGYRVLEAAGAMQAQYHAHAQRKIHLVVIDLPAPETCHLELARWFRAFYPETKVLLTSSSFWELNLQLGGPQHIAILAKPFTPLELARMVRLILDEVGGM
jgi:CheY-like chemotaxis protein